jgi:hypothetical protein
MARTLTTSSATSGAADRWRGNFKKIVPEGDSKERAVCRECGFINYQNPKIVAGVVALSSTYVPIIIFILKLIYTNWRIEL